MKMPLDVAHKYQQVSNFEIKKLKKIKKKQRDL